MDRGPFGTSRPTERRVPARSHSTSSETASQPPKVVQHEVNEESKPVYREATQHRSTKERTPLKRIIIPVIAAIIVVAIGLAAWKLLGAGVTAATPGIDSSKYQAVFFTNGQVYFGKLQSLNAHYMKMTDIYYLQTQEAQAEADEKNPQETTSEQNSNVQLIKLGNEVHGPEDEMIISREQVLFYENLKADGKVAQTIAQNKKQ